MIFPASAALELQSSCSLNFCEAPKTIRVSGSGAGRLLFSFGVQRTTSDRRSKRLYMPGKVDVRPRCTYNLGGRCLPSVDAVMLLLLHRGGKRRVDIVRLTHVTSPPITYRQSRGNGGLLSAITNPACTRGLPLQLQQSYYCIHVAVCTSGCTTDVPSLRCCSVLNYHHRRLS